MVRQSLLRVAGAIVAGAVLLGACAPASPTPSGATGAPAAPAAPAASPTTPPLETVSYGIASRSYSYLPIVIAEREGFYRQRGLNVEIQNMTPVQIAAGQIANQLDYGTGYVQAIRAGGGPLRVVSAQITGPIFTVMAKPGIGAIADLRGKTLGTGSRGAAQERTTIQILEHYGLVADRDVTLLPFPEIPIVFQALVGGQVDAAALSPPWQTRARQQGMVRLVDAADVDPVPLNGLVVTPARLAQQRDQVRRVVMAEIGAYRFIHGQRAETEAIVRDWLGASAEEAAEGYDAALPVISRDAQLDLAALRRLVQSEQVDGLAPPTLTVEELVDPTLAAEALRAVDAERGR
jgi:ABC-type nitrate/sulfonate/bicarbonate transport system substrate-binding protein